MDEDLETPDWANIDVQVKGLRSGSTRLRIEVLRHILQAVEAASSTTDLHASVQHD